MGFSGRNWTRFREMYFYQSQLTLQMTVKTITVIKPLKDLRERFLSDTSDMSPEEIRLLTHFVDFLDRALTLNPEKRLLVREALVHPFIYGNMVEMLT